MKNKGKILTLERIGGTIGVLGIICLMFFGDIMSVTFMGALGGMIFLLLLFLNWGFPANNSPNVFFVTLQ